MGMWQDLKSVEVLPIIILFITSKRMSLLTTENLNLEKACLVNLALNNSVCEAMVVRNKSGYTADQEIEVQKLVATMVAYKTAILGIFPFFVMLFLISWSDKYKVRKPFIMLPIYGHIVLNLGCYVCTFFFLELPIEVAIFFESIPVAVTGTWPCFFVGIHSYVSEHSSLEKRTYLIGITVMFTWTSKFVGIALSGIAQRLIGFYGVYCICILFDSIAIIYGNIVIRDESHHEIVNGDTVLKDIFDCKRIYGTMSKLFMNANRKRNLSLILVLLINSVRFGTNKGQEAVTYMFTRRKFTWDEVDYSRYICYHSIMNFIGSFLGVSVLVKWLKLDDSIIGMITMVSGICGCLANSMATNSGYFYLATLPEIFAFSDQMVSKSILSKLVAPDELGQAFSVSAVFEAPAPLIFGPLYSFLYYKTISRFPGSFFMMTAFTQVAIILSFLWLYLKKTTKPVEIDVRRQNQKDLSFTSGNPEERKMVESDEVEKIAQCPETFGKVTA